MADESRKVEDGPPCTADKDGDILLEENKRTRSETRNKQAQCRVCLRKFRSDNIKRHIKTHKDLYSLDENEIRDEIKERKRQYENREERRRLVHEIALQEGAPLECIEETVNPALDGLATHPQQGPII